MNQYDFAGRRAVVTGAASGIGRAISARLTSSGARVALWDCDADRVRSVASKLGSVPVEVDVADFGSVGRAAKQTLERFDGIDVLVNCAGIAGATSPVETYPIDEFDRVLKVSLYGTFYCCQSLVPAMKVAGYGRIVNFASMAGKEGNPNASAYSAAKAGVIALTKSLGKELAKSGVIVNAVAPAVIKTEMADSVSPEHLRYMLEKIPMGRMGTVEEAAQLVLWLLSEDCSFSTGAVYDLSGGRATY
jgi:2-dehydro-3-deoxy-L-rhamnonate dehydrogenase (NAD+)